MDPIDAGVSVIDERVADHGRAGQTRWLVPLVAIATMVVVAMVAALLWLRRDDTPGPAAVPTSVPSSAASASPAPASASPTLAPSPSPSAVGTTIAAPVYYVADVEGGPRLYREFHRVPVLAGGPALTALTEMFRDNAADPDYSSMWPASTRVLSVAVSGSTATVDLSGFVSLGSSFEGAAVQQLVYTVTAAEPTVSTVRLLVNGATPPSGHMDWSAPIARDNPLNVQASVWILTPTQGTTVSSPVRVTVFGTGWEGNVPLKVYQGETVVASTFVTTMMGGFAEASTTITLPAGSYEVRAYNDNGLDSSLKLWDTKAFTVK
ncbi:MAG: GerMN domain-containing protein [Kineosporiaceae bacterium]|jgi:hypothetical protein